MEGVDLVDVAVTPGARHRLAHAGADVVIDLAGIDCEVDPRFGVWR